MLQFLVAGVVVIVLLGDGTLDGELGGGDIGKAIAAAALGAAVFSATWSGGRYGWWGELGLAALAVVGGAVGLVADVGPGLPLLAVGVLWLALALLPASRAWFLQPD